MSKKLISPFVHRVLLENMRIRISDTIKGNHFNVASFAHVTKSCHELSVFRDLGPVVRVWNFDLFLALYGGRVEFCPRAVASIRDAVVDVFVLAVTVLSLKELSWPSPRS